MRDKVSECEINVVIRGRGRGDERKRVISESFCVCSRVV